MATDLNNIYTIYNVLKSASFFGANFAKQISQSHYILYYGKFEELFYNIKKY